MTCIIGCIENDKIYIAGDSAGESNGFGISRADTKVFTKKTNNDYPLILGFCHSFRYGQLLKYKWDVPKYDESLDFEDYLHNDFIDSIYEIANEHFLDDKNPENKELSDFVVGFRNKLFTVGEDLQIEVIHPSFSNFLCVGCGAEIAYGAMEGMKDIEVKERLTRALQISSKYYSASVRPPYIIKEIKIEK